MKQMQSDFFEKVKLSSARRVIHGGREAVGKRKSRRPISIKKPMYIVMKSSRAEGNLRMNSKKNEERVKELLKKQAKKFGVRILQLANLGDQLHLLLKSSSKNGFQNFLRSITALIARFITGAKKGKVFGRFWDFLAFSQILQSRREFRKVADYILAITEYLRGRKFVFNITTLRGS